MDEERIREIFNEELIKVLGAFATVPYEVGEALIERLGVNNKAELEVSTKDVDDVTQEINEGGSGTYDVLKAPDGFKQFTEGNTTIHLPYYNS